MCLRCAHKLEMRIVSQASHISSAEMGRYMKNKLRRIKSIKSVAVLCGFITMLLADGFLFYTEYQNYNQKIEILCKMLEAQVQGEDGLMTASGLLKGMENINGRKGRELLKTYGYLSEYENEYGRQMKAQMLQTGAVSLLIYTGFLLSVYLLLKQMKLKRNKELNELDKILTDFRKGIYKYREEKPYSPVDNVKNRIYDQLAALGEYLKLLDERMTRDKEETKALVTDISHQLKTPVAALKACFEILGQEDLKPEEKREFSDRCSRQLKGLEDLLAALINISRMETGMIQIKMEEACIYDTLVEAVNRVYMKAQEKQIEIEMEAEEQLQRLKAAHDRKWFCEAIINLLENAVKYSPENTCITIRMLERTTFLRIEIIDQGIGIPKEEYHQIFKRFYRGKSEKVKKQPGSGIGLYLTREIISRHSGTITVTSGNQTLSAGAVFTIQLPRTVTKPSEPFI